MKKTCLACGEKKVANRTDASEFGWMSGRERHRPNCKLCVNLIARRGRNNDDKAAKRLKAVKDQEAIESDPYGFLAADIIEKAITDLKKYGHINERLNRSHTKHKTDVVDVCAAAINNGFDSPHDDLMAFFGGAWFEELAGYAGCEAEYLRKHILESE